jgi:hypothetical protein
MKSKPGFDPTMKGDRGLMDVGAPAPMPAAKPKAKRKPKAKKRSA